MNSVLQYVLYVGILVAFSIPLGFYISLSEEGSEHCAALSLLCISERACFENT